MGKNLDDKSEVLPKSTNILAILKSVQLDSVLTEVN